MTYVLGVDAGGTKTLALVARFDGTIVGSGRGGCGDIYATPSPNNALVSVEDAVHQALRAAGAQSAELVGGGFSMAGADWPEDFTFLHQALAGRGFGRTIRVVNDAIGALRVAIPSGPGAIVVCGTGMAIGARGSDGRIWHTSFWQEPQGGAELAQKTLRAVYRADLGVDPLTMLTERVLAIFEQSTVEAVLHQLTARDRQRVTSMQSGLLVRALLDAASHGDVTARSIVQQHGTAVGDYALAAARYVGIEQTAFTLALAGGVLRHTEPLLTTTIANRVREMAPAVRITTSRFEPIVGALLIAFDAAGVALDAPLLERLEGSLPPSAFYAT